MTAVCMLGVYSRDSPAWLRDRAHSYASTQPYLHALVVGVLMAIVAVGGRLACIVTLWHALAGGLQSACKRSSKATGWLWLNACTSLGPACVPPQEAWPDAASEQNITDDAEPNLLLFKLILAGGVQP